MHLIHPFLIMFLFSSHLYANEISQKLILSSHKDLKLTQNDLLALKVYFIENEATRRLQEKYSLKMKIENFSDYKALVLAPIHNIEVRNELMVLIMPLFPEIFYAENIKNSKKINALNQKTVESTILYDVKSNDAKSFLDELGLQWLAIWILAVFGLVLSIRNRRKIAQLKETQEKIKIDQKNIETEINHLGDENV